MKTLHKKLLVLILAAGVGCTHEFEEINTDPSIVTTPDVKYLLTFAENNIVTYQGTEWVWEYMEHLLRYTQHVTADPYELSGNVNSRYNAFYRNILPNLEEIRKQIDRKPDVARYQNMKAITHILQVLQAMKVSDMNGSIPYEQAARGRYDGKFDPAYDDQQKLFSMWVDQLDDAINVLSANLTSDQETYGSADLFFQSDWTKWVKVANTLKLRIAVRMESQDANEAEEIFDSVMQDAIGPIDGDDAQMLFRGDNYTPFGSGGNIDYRSRRFATSNIIDFFKRTSDPRIYIYFQENDLTGDYATVLNDYGVTLPDFIDPADPLIQYQGGPADWTVEPDVAAYFNNALAAGPERFFLISPINRKFFAPRLNNAPGKWVDIVVGYAETCFYIAEFIAKGYGTGSAAEWYNKGIASSIRTMNMLATEAQSTTAYTGDGTTIIEAYQNHPDIVLDGTNDLERIYVQQFLNFYRQPNEAFVFCRRTGYPTFNSTYYSRAVYNQVIPRRFWLNDPGEVNRKNWETAMTQQGFTPRSQNVDDLNQQRVWYDKVAPDFGEGD